MKKRELLLALTALGFVSFSYTDISAAATGTPQRSALTDTRQRAAAFGLNQAVTMLKNDAVSSRTAADKSNTSQPDSVAQNAPQRRVLLNFEQVAPAPGSVTLLGIRPDESVKFSVRSDEVISRAVLNLEYTPSPSLIPVQSQLKVSLNNELMGVIPISADMLGKKNQAQFVIDPRYVTDFNDVKLSFIGHYIQVCENQANTTLWLDVSKSSNLDLTYEPLALKNDLSRFPEPFFDNRDNRSTNIPVIFASSPSAAEQKAAGILASWFGTLGKWRGQTFPVLFGELPDRHGIVFATNDKRPAFLNDYPRVDGPTVEMISHPDNPYVKLLIIMGRDDNDLILAAQGIAQGNVIFRGQSVQVNDVKQLAPRKPYDAPNWVRTDRPTRFSELLDYEGQLQASGFQLAPITVNLGLPPDLYLHAAQGIDMRIKYRYTPPFTQDGSRLNISLNDLFVRSFTLEQQKREGSQLMQIPVLQGLLDGGENLSVPELKLGATNQLRFDFFYSNPIIGGTPERCETYQQIPNYAVIDDRSTIDFSGFRHFIAMPDLRAFISAGFPFSRMADLSETLIVVNKNPEREQVGALLNMAGQFGAQLGYPSLRLNITDDWQTVQNTDADLLVIGTIPQELTGDDKLNALVDAAKSWVKMPFKQTQIFNEPVPLDASAAETRTDIAANGPIAAVIGFESPYHNKRSVVAVLADSERGYALFNQAINDSGKRAAIFGSVSVIRESGVSSLRVGDVYYVGYLPWWERVWYALATHPVILAVLAVLSVVLLAWVLWRILRYLSRRKILPDEDL